MSVFCQIGSEIFCMGNFFMFFSLNSSQMIPLQIRINFWGLFQRKKLKKEYFLKKIVQKSENSNILKLWNPPKKLNFQLFSTFIFYKSLFRCLLLFWKNELLKKCFLLFYFRKTAENELFSRFSRKLGELHVRFCFWPKIRIQRYKKIRNPSKHLWDQKLTWNCCMC